MKKKLILKIVLLSFFSCLTACKSNPKQKDKQIVFKAKRPNILLLLADDLGYGELGSYGQEVIKTPVLDSLAKQGLRFTDFYAGNAVCSPSRAVLMTGISSSYNTLRGNRGHYEKAGWMRVALKKSEMTMAEMLKEAGYQTGFIGKWHLDDSKDLSTWAYNRGFDFSVQEQWGASSKGQKYDEDMHWINGKQDSIYYRLNEWECKDEFRTNIALDYLDKIEKQKPFFLFMSYRAPHGREDEIGNTSLYADKNWPAKERLHASKITLLDKQIGRLLKKLEDLGALENTLVLFTSDNGPHAEGRGHKVEFFNSNGALQGHKRDLYEGGIRVPLIAYWNGKITASKITNHVSGFQDLMPTFAEIAGVKKPEQTNGISLLPVLTGSKQKKHESLNWEFQLDGIRRKMPDGGFRQSARIESFKGVRYGVSAEIELYNLDTDISENYNISSQHPKMVQKMQELFKKSRSKNAKYPYGGVIQNEKPSIKK